MREQPSASPYLKVDLRLLPCLFLCYVLAYLDRVNVGFAKLQMLADLSLGDAAFATGALGLVLSGVFATRPVLAMAFLSLGTLGVLGSMPLFWPIPSAFRGAPAAAAGIGIVNSIGNLGGYIGPNVPVWVKRLTPDPSAALYVTSGVLLIGAALTALCIPASVDRAPGANAQ
jgi:nitrate/nitrite transporter NarK